MVSRRLSEDSLAQRPLAFKKNLIGQMNRQIMKANSLAG